MDVSNLLFRDDKALVPPKSERVAELPDPPGGGTNITRYVPHVYIGVFLNIFRGSPQLVFAAEILNSNTEHKHALKTHNSRQQKRQIST